MILTSTRYVALCDTVHYACIVCIMRNASYCINMLCIPFIVKTVLCTHELGGMYTMSDIEYSMSDILYVKVFH